MRRSLVDQIVSAYLKQLGRDRPVKPLERMAANTYVASVADAMIAKMVEKGMTLVEPQKSEIEKMYSEKYTKAAYDYFVELRPYSQSAVLEAHYRALAAFPNHRPRVDFRSADINNRALSAHRCACSGGSRSMPDRVRHCRSTGFLASGAGSEPRINGLQPPRWSGGFAGSNPKRATPRQRPLRIESDPR